MYIIGSAVVITYGIYKIIKYIVEDEQRILEYNTSILNKRLVSNTYHKISDLKKLYLSNVRNSDNISEYLIDIIFNIVPKYTTINYNSCTRNVSGYEEYPTESRTRLVDLIHLNGLTNCMYVCLTKEQQDVLDKIQSNYNYKINCFYWNATEKKFEELY